MAVLTACFSEWKAPPFFTACALCASASTLKEIGATHASQRLLRLHHSNLSTQRSSHNIQNSRTNNSKSENENSSHRRSGGKSLPDSSCCSGTKKNSRSSVAYPEGSQSSAGGRPLISELNTAGGNSASSEEVTAASGGGALSAAGTAGSCNNSNSGRPEKTAAAAAGGGVCCPSSSMSSGLHHAAGRKPGSCVVLLQCSEQQSPAIKLPLNKFLATRDVLLSLDLVSDHVASFAADFRCCISLDSLSAAAAHVLPCPSVLLSLAYVPGGQSTPCMSSSASAEQVDNDNDTSASVLFAAPAAGAFSSGPHSAALTRKKQESIGAAASAVVVAETWQDSVEVSAAPSPPAAAWWDQLLQLAAIFSDDSAAAASSAATTSGLLRYLQLSMHNVVFVNGQYRSLTLLGHPVLLQLFVAAVSSATDPMAPAVMSTDRSSALQRLSNTSQTSAGGGDATAATSEEAVATVFAASSERRCWRVTATTKLSFTLQQHAARLHQQQPFAAAPDPAFTEGEEEAVAAFFGRKKQGGLNTLGGLHKLLPELSFSLFLPLLRCDFYTSFHVQLPKGLLLFGLPGTGKTKLANAVAAELHSLAAKANTFTFNLLQQQCLQWLQQSQLHHSQLQHSQLEQEEQSGEANRKMQQHSKKKVSLSERAEKLLLPLLTLPMQHGNSKGDLQPQKQYQISSSFSPVAEEGLQERRVFIVAPHFELVNATELLSPLVGQTEKNIYSLFERCRTQQRQRVCRAAAAASAAVASLKAAAAAKVGATGVDAIAFEEQHQSPILEVVGGTTLLFLDEIDAICPKREEATESGRRAVCALLSCIDGIQSDGSLFVLAATNHAHLLDNAICRPGRLERELEVTVPNSEERCEILEKLLEDVPHNLSSQEIDELASLTQAFVPADLRLLVTTAATNAFTEALAKKRKEFCKSPFFALDCKRVSSPSSWEAESPESQLVLKEEQNSQISAEETICMHHFKAALCHVKPSALKSMAADVPHIRWGDIGGYEEAKQSLQECVEWPLKYAHLFKKLKICPPRGVLLYGPPGCSKTMMAKAVATESKMNFISVKGPELFSKWVGDSERAVREVFRKARQNAPCVIFFDEVDAMGADRQTGDAGGVDTRVLSQLLNEMDGIGPVREVVVIAATNRPDLLDAALLRPGRLDRLIYISLPNFAARTQIAYKTLKGMPLRLQTQKTAEICSKQAALKLSSPIAVEQKSRIQLVHQQETQLQLQPQYKREHVVDSGEIGAVNKRDNSSESGGGTAAITSSESPAAVEATGRKVRFGGLEKEVNDRTGWTEEERELRACADWLASKTDGYSGAEMVMLCREASMQAVREAVFRFSSRNTFLNVSTEEKSKQETRNSRLESTEWHSRTSSEDSAASATTAEESRNGDNRAAPARSAVMFDYVTNGEEERVRCSEEDQPHCVEVRTEVLTEKDESGCCLSTDEMHRRFSVESTDLRKTLEKPSSRTRKSTGSVEGDEVYVEKRHLEEALQLVKPRTPESLLQFYERYYRESVTRRSVN